MGTTDLARYRSTLLAIAFSLIVAACTDLPPLPPDPAGTAGVATEAPTQPGVFPDPASACPQSTETLQALRNPRHGYCLAYPEAYKVEKPNPDEIILLIGGLLDASHARVHIKVQDAAGRTAEQVATSLAEEFKDFGIVTRSLTSVAGTTATVLDNVPGQDINRRVFFSNNDLLYEIYFSPADPAVGQAYTEMEQLYDQVLHSFTFIPKTSEVANDCLTPGAGERLLSSSAGGFCLLYPARFQLDESLPDQFELYVDSLLNTDDPKLFVNVEDANGRTAEDVAGAIAAEAHAVLPDLAIDRSFGWTIGYEPAEFLDGVPGQDLSRQLIVVHDDKLYRLTFVPSDPTQPAVYAEMEALFEQVLRSWRFLPRD